MLLWVVAALAVSFFLYALWRGRDLPAKPGCLPGCRGLPIFGESFAFLSNPTTFIRTRQAKYGDIFLTNVLFNDMVMICDPQSAKKVLGQTERTFIPYVPSSARDIIGHRSMPFLRFDFHALLRDTMMRTAMGVPALTPQLGELEKFATEWVHQRFRTNGEMAKVGPRFRGFNVRVVYRILYGWEEFVDEPVDFEQLDRDLESISRGTVTLPIKLPFYETPYARSMKAVGRVRAIAAKRITAIRKMIKEGTTLPHCFCAKIVQTDERFDDEVLTHSLTTFMLAGIDTTATTMTWIWAYLGKYPDVYEKMRDENLKLAAEIEKRGEPLRWSDFHNIPVTDRIITEVLRLSPSFGTFRQVMHDTTILGYGLKRGTRLMVPVRTIQRDERHWPNPEEFSATRFASEKYADGLGSRKLLTFGNGARYCVGRYVVRMEIRTLFHVLFREADRQKWPIEISSDVEPQFDIAFAALPTKSEIRMG